MRGPRNSQRPATARDRRRHGDATALALSPRDRRCALRHSERCRGGRLPPAERLVWQRRLFGDWPLPLAITPRPAKARQTQPGRPAIFPDRTILADSSIQPLSSPSAGLRSWRSISRSGAQRHHRVDARRLWSYLCTMKAGVATTAWLDACCVPSIRQKQSDRDRDQPRM